MEGEALVWFQDLEEFGQLTDWDAFVKALLSNLAQMPMMNPWNP